MPTIPEQQTSSRELAAMVSELEEAEAYEVKLRQCIIDARDQLAAGNTSIALSILNTAINDIDAATDVVAGSHSEGRSSCACLAGGTTGRSFVMEGSVYAPRERVGITSVGEHAITLAAGGLASNA